MNTPAHLILGAAAFARPEQRWTLPAALLGGLAPDLSLYLLVAWHLLILGTPAQIVFDQLYFSDLWQQIFAIDNSFVLWGTLLGLALWRRHFVLIAFSGAAVAHILLDFPLHAGDGRPHLWPLTMWVFDSPLSYWDNDFGAWIIGPMELLLSAVLTVFLWRRFQAWAWRGLFAFLLLAEMASNNIWLFVF